MSEQIYIGAVITDGENFRVKEIRNNLEEMARDNYKSQVFTGGIKKAYKQNKKYLKNKQSLQNNLRIK